MLEFGNVLLSGSDGAQEDGEQEIWELDLPAPGVTVQGDVCVRYEHWSDADL